VNYFNALRKRMPRLLVQEDGFEGKELKLIGSGTMI
jgi:hypothetical protein